MVVGVAISPEVTARERDFAVLRAFDLNEEYGPSAGMTRLERWMRAERNGLHPPANVRSLVESHPGDATYVEWSVFFW